MFCVFQVPGNAYGSSRRQLSPSVVLLPIAHAAEGLEEAACQAHGCVWQHERDDSAVALGAVDVPLAGLWKWMQQRSAGAVSCAQRSCL